MDNEKDLLRAENESLKQIIKERDAQYRSLTSAIHAALGRANRTGKLRMVNVHELGNECVRLMWANKMLREEIALQEKMREEKTQFTHG